MADQPSNDLRPDLDDSINVSEAHAILNDDGAAVTREKSLRENGMEPVSLWMMLTCGIILLVGGSVLGKSGLFNYDLFPQGYLREKNPFAADAPLPPVPYGDLAVREGAKVYGKCIGCHGADGAGGSGIPPLANSEWVTGNTAMLSQIILHGLKGEISVAGVNYNGNMPSMADGLGPKELAFVMTYIRGSFGNSAPPVSIAQAANGLELAKSQSGQVDVPILRAKYDKMLEGADISSDTLFDQELFEPIEAASAE
ncbi:MAG: c-type cytochrome [Akkermansiaceae bacterium]